MENIDPPLQLSTLNKITCTKYNKCIKRIK